MSISAIKATEKCSWSTFSRLHLAHPNSSFHTFHSFIELMFVLCWMLHPDVGFRAKLGDLMKYPWFTRDVDVSSYDYDTVLSGKVTVFKFKIFSS